MIGLLMFCAGLLAGVVGLLRLFSARTLADILLVGALIGGGAALVCAGVVLIGAAVPPRVLVL